MDRKHVDRMVEAWRHTCEHMLDRGNWYRLGGRDFGHGVDCSGFAVYVLSRIGFKGRPGQLSVWDLFHEDIWRDTPDYNSFGSKAEQFCAYFQDDGSGKPSKTLTHVALKYNCGYGIHSTGAYYDVGHGQSISSILRNVRALYTEWGDGPGGTFNVAQFTADMDAFLTQDITPMFPDMEVSSIPRVFEVAPGDFRTVLGLQIEESDIPTGVSKDYNANYTEYLKAFAKNFGLVGGLFGMIKDFKVINKEGSQFDYSQTKPLVETITEAFNNLTQSDAVKWVINQLSNKDMAATGQKNGVQAFPIDQLRANVSNGNGVMTKYLDGRAWPSRFNYCVTVM